MAKRARLKVAVENPDRQVRGYCYGHCSLWAGISLIVVRRQWQHSSVPSRIMKSGLYTRLEQNGCDLCASVIWESPCSLIDGIVENSGKHSLV